MTEVDFSAQEPGKTETTDQQGALPEKQRASEDVVFLVLAYLGILSLIPFFVAKDNEYVRWHAKQGLVLLAFEIILWIVLMILGAVPIVGVIIAFLGFFIWLAILVLHIFCIIKALKGEKWYVPVIGVYADKF